MSRQWLMFVVCVSVFAALLAILKFREYSTRRKFRSLRCPKCEGAFEIPKLVALKRWMDFDPDRNSLKGSGIYLSCPNCACDYRFTDKFEYAGPDEAKSN